MKTLKDLMEIIAFAIEENNDVTSKQWFVSFSGHVNKIEITYYMTGWGDGDNPSERIEQKITEEGIQALYWFVKTRLRKIEDLRNYNLKT